MLEPCDWSFSGGNSLNSSTEATKPATGVLGVAGACRRRFVDDHDGNGRALQSDLYAAPDKYWSTKGVCGGGGGGGVVSYACRKSTAASTKSHTNFCLHTASENAHIIYRLM